MKHYNLFVGNNNVTTKKKDYVFFWKEVINDPGKLMAFHLRKVSKFKKRLLKTFAGLIKTNNAEFKYLLHYIKKNGIPEYNEEEMNSLVYATYSIGSVSENKLAVKSARDAFNSFKDVTLENRIKIIEIFRERLIQKKDVLARGAEALLLSHIFEVSFDNTLSSILDPKAFKLYKEQLTPKKLSENSYLFKKPYGVFGIVLPYNLVLFESLMPIVSSIISGNTCVIKIPKYPVALLEMISIFYEIFDELGLPKGIINTVTGSGREIVSEYIENDDVSGVIFYGNSKSGLEIGSNVLKKGKKAIIELAGSDPALVWNDVDIDNTVEQILLSRFFASGQLCLATKRLFVHNDIFDEFVDKLVKRVSQLKCILSDPENVNVMDQSTIGSVKSMIDLKSIINDAVENGAKVNIGGKSINRYGKEDNQGLFFSPTILTDVTLEMKVMKEETFGPILPIMRIHSLDEVIKLINESKYGLRSSVWSNDKVVIDTFINEVNAGGTMVNKFDWFNDAFSPHIGGTKMSGITGCKYFTEEMCYSKYVYIGIKK